MKPLAYQKNRAHDLIQGCEDRLESGAIDEGTWHREIAAVITPSYLAGDNPRRQSGHSGDEARWKQARGLIGNAFYKNGTFLDVGCANGYLMESIERWNLERGYEIEPYGVDISPELAALARERLPHWSDRIHTANALYWKPAVQYTYVRTGLDYVPQRRHKDFIQHLLNNAVLLGGRLIIGTYNEEKELKLNEDHLTGLGFTINGRSERTHSDPRLAYKVIWIDKS